MDKPSNTTSFTQVGKTTNCFLFYVSQYVEEIVRQVPGTYREQFRSNTSPNLQHTKEMVRSIRIRGHFKLCRITIASIGESGSTGIAKFKPRLFEFVQRLFFLTATIYCCFLMLFALRTNDQNGDYFHLPKLCSCFLDVTVRCS